MTRTRTIGTPFCPSVILSILFCVAPSTAQVPVELTIDGGATVAENSYAYYTATALFDDGQEFEVTLFCDWSVEPDTYASIDRFARLTTEQVPKDQEIVVGASFVWDEIQVEDAMGVTIIDVPPDEGADPWPFWGRTTTRIANTATVGPQTPTIDWSVLISTFAFENINEASPVMDAHGRIFQGTIDGMTGVDSVAREVLWMETDGDVTRGTAVWGGRVVWGDFSPFSTLYCHDAATGQELWTFQAPTAFSQTAPVVDPNGVVYIPDALGAMYARRMEDGSEVWTTEIGAEAFDAPSLDWPLLLTSCGGFVNLVGIDPLTGDIEWTFGTESLIQGTSVHFDQRVYVGSNDRYLYCIDAETGVEIWRFWCEQSNRGSVGVGHDDTVYTATSGNEGILFAVSSDGEELWRYYAEGLVFNAPIVSGDGTIYFCSQLAPDLGWVHAVRSDGTELWTREMTQQVTASPMLAPDGTLYVVSRDKFLYAFRDPVGDLDFDGDIDLDDFAKFEECLTGPRLWGEAAKTTPGCELLDFDSDWDVDFTDFAQFQLAFTGP